MASSPSLKKKSMLATARSGRGEQLRVQLPPEDGSATPGGVSDASLLLKDGGGESGGESGSEGPSLLPSTGAPVGSSRSRRRNGPGRRPSKVRLAKAGSGGLQSEGSGGLSGGSDSEGSLSPDKRRGAAGGGAAGSVKGASLTPVTPLPRADSDHPLHQLYSQPWVDDGTVKEVRDIRMWGLAPCDTTDEALPGCTADPLLLYPDRQVAVQKRLMAICGLYSKAQVEASADGGDAGGWSSSSSSSSSSSEIPTVVFKQVTSRVQAGTAQHIQCFDSKYIGPDHKNLLPTSSLPET